MTARLQDELKQTKPFRSLEEEATLSIVRTAAMLEHALAQALRPHGITATQYNVLRIVRGAGPEGLCRNEVGARLVRAVPDVTRLLDRMEEMGVIVRERGDKDRRVVRTRATKKGLDLAARVDADVAAYHGARFKKLDRKALRTLVELLGAVRERC
jgi:DNA-binding MarR family transcriptional regulator